MFNLHANGRNIVGCYMLRPFAHPVACCVFLGVVASVYTPLPTRTQQVPTLLDQQCWELCSLQCRRIVGGRNLVRVRNIVVVAIFDFMTVEDWGEYK